MHPKSMRQQNAPHDSGQRATSQGKHPSSQRPQTRASMTTEYQERFLAPHCHAAAISTSTQKDPFNPLRATSADTTTFRSYYVTQKWTKHQPKAPQPSVSPKTPQRCALHNPVRFVANQKASALVDYTSVYKSDFQACKINKRQPYKLTDSLKVNQGLVVMKSSSKESQNSAQDAATCKPVPFESVTSYRSDFVAHPVQPRTRRQKPAYQTNKGLPLEHQVPPKPKAAWDINQGLFDEASEFFKQFKTWSLETKFHGQGKAKVSSPPADNANDKFLSTTHADYKAHECQCTKPVLPSMQNGEKSKEPFQATTTMREDYKAWETTPRLPTVHKEKPDGPKKTAFSACAPKSAESHKTNPKPFSPHPKLNETAVCDSSCNATEKHNCPAENGATSGFECISTPTEEFRRFWTTSLDRGVTWPDGDIREEPTQALQ